MGVVACGLRNEIIDLDWLTRITIFSECFPVGLPCPPDTPKETLNHFFSGFYPEPDYVPAVGELQVPDLVIGPLCRVLGSFNSNGHVHKRLPVYINGSELSPENF
jgi:hypothetical protein